MTPSSTPVVGLMIASSGPLDDCHDPLMKVPEPGTPRVKRSASAGRVATGVSKKAFSPVMRPRLHIF